MLTLYQFRLHGRLGKRSAINNQAVYQVIPAIFPGPVQFQSLFMKPLIAIFLLTFMDIALSAQVKDSFYVLRDHCLITFRQFNRNGDPVGRVVYQTVQVHRQKDMDSIRLLAAQYNRNGIRVSLYPAQVQCSKGTLWWDMGLTGPAALVQKIRSFQVRTQQASMVYPDSMQKGDSLDDGYMEMDLDLEGKTISREQMSITDRKVEGMDRITTPAGTWNCYRISYTARLRTSLLGIGIPLVFRYREWFAPGFGLVKRQAYRKKNKLSGSLILVSIQKYP